MKKSGEFWLNCLEDDVREKWLKNYDPDFLIYRDLMTVDEYLVREMSFTDFINDAFSWYPTPEGDTYWIDICNIDEKKLIRNYKLKQLGI